MKRTLGRRAAVVALGVLAVLSAWPASAVSAQDSDSDSESEREDDVALTIKSCAEQARDGADLRPLQVLVLVLLDESTSLRRNDPTAQRVAGLRDLLTAMDLTQKSMDATRRDGDVSGRLEISVSIDGFSTEYEERSDGKWHKLSDEQALEALLQSADGFTGRTKGYTNYANAMAGANKRLLDQASAARLEGAHACSLLVWFTDGQHDTDNRGALSPVEREVIESQLCQADGPVDMLREQGVAMAAVRLGAASSGGSLLDAIASGDRFSFDEQTSASRVCGLNPSTGRVYSVADAASLADLLHGMSDILYEGIESLPNLRRCGEGSFVDTVLLEGEAVGGACSYAFELAPWVKSVDIKYKHPAVDPEATFRVSLIGVGMAGPGLDAEFDLEDIDSNEAAGRLAAFSLQRPAVNWWHLSGANPDIRNGQGASSAASYWGGRWILRFEGTGAQEALISDRFFEQELTLDVTGEPRRGYRDTFENINVKLVDRDTGEEVGSKQRSFGIKIAHIGPDGNETAENLSCQGSSLCAIPNDFLWHASESDVTSESLRLVFDVQEMFSPPGDGDPLERSHAPINRILWVGEDPPPPELPRVIGASVAGFDDATDGILAFEVTGPADDDGVVTLTDVRSAEGEAGQVTLAQDPVRCQVSAGMTAVCEAALEAGFIDNREVDVVASFALEGKNAAGDVERGNQQMPIRVRTTAPVDRSNLVSAFLAMLGLFVLVQLLLRAWFTTKLARWAPLATSARYGALDVRVAPDGAVARPGVGRLSAQPELMPFVPRGLTDAGRKAVLDEAPAPVTLHISWWRTFLGESGAARFVRSQRVVIRATAPGAHCFGPGGSTMPDSRSTALRAGLLGETLREGWVLSIAPQGLRKLGEGRSADAVLVAIDLPADDPARLSDRLENTADRASAVIGRHLPEPSRRNADASGGAGSAFDAEIPGADGKPRGGAGDSANRSLGESAGTDDAWRSSDPDDPLP